MRRLVTRVLGAGALVCAVSLAACSLLAPTSTLRANSADAGDAGTDAPSADGAVPDGAPDARVDGGSRFCTSTTTPHTVCEDFDDGAFSKAWTMQACNGCSLTVAQGASTSLPYALSTALPRRAANDAPTYVTLLQSLSGWQRTRVELDLQVKSTLWLPSDVNAGVLCLTFESDVGVEGSCVSVGQDYVTLSAPASAVSGSALGWDKWHHLVLELDPKGSAALTIDGITISTVFTALAVGANPTTKVDVGIHGYNAPSPDFSVLFDNVTIDRL